MRGGRYPNMPFNQQVSIPCDLSLHHTADGLRMLRNPIPELATLERTRHTWPTRVLSPNTPWHIGTAWPLLRITCNIALAPNAKLTLNISGTHVTATPGTIAILASAQPTTTPAEQPTTTSAEQPTTTPATTPAGQPPAAPAEQVAAGAAEQATITAVRKLDILVDTTSIEVFANDGEASLTACVLPGHFELTFTAFGADCTLGELEVVELASIWPKV